jgi:hypothetical protein
MQTPGDGSDSPTVTIEPLRIVKPTSPPNNRNRTNSASRFASPPPSNKPTFPLPPGASSSASPLPYPDDDDDDLFQKRPTNPPYPDDRGKAPDRTGSGDQERIFAGSSRKGAHDTAPRFTSPTEKIGPGLSERRGNAPQPLPASPELGSPDREGLFTRLPGHEQNGQGNRHYYPPPIPKPTSSNVPAILSPTPRNDMNRFASTASTSTTRATRGSPPPPETPIDQPAELGGIEARYAASGIPGNATLSSLQAQNAAAAQRANQYAPPPVPQMPQSPPARPWTPTESPENAPHGPPRVYQGMNEITPTASPPAPARPDRQPQPAQVSTLEQDFQRMQMSAEEPPPAYSSVTPATANSQAYPNEKQQRPTPPAAIDTAPKPNIAPPLATPANNPDHPAFANDPREQAVPVQQQPVEATAAPSVQPANTSPFQGVGPTSPPPLPEGWIAHLDQNSGQYYYIHLPTQATQWEFPKGPTPLNDVPLSPVHSTYAGSAYGNPLASPGLSMFNKQNLASPGFQNMASPGFLGSPGFPPHTPGYAESIMSMASGTPTTAGFSGPPPSAGVDMYKVAPTNGVYFGPYLRYVNMDMQNGVWLGTILLVTDAPQPPTIHIHKSVDLSPNPRQLKPNPIFTHQRWVFYRYDVDLQMGEGQGDKWTYAITSHLGCTRYEFLVAGRYETNWRFIAHSGNDFAMNTTANERSKLGGIGFMWKDILQKNVECGGFHVQLGLGDQIYGDRLWKEVPLLKQWLAMSGKENRRSAAWTARHEEDVSHAYFHYYTSHFDQPYLREAFAQIPHVLQIDDHDM